MRAGGLLAGIGLLVAGWFGWLVESSGVPAAAAPQRVLGGPRPPRPVSARLALRAPAGLQALPVSAELQSGEPLAAALSRLGRPERLSLLAGERTPGLSALGPLAAAAPAALVAVAPAGRSAHVGSVAPGRAPVWVSLFAGDVRLASRTVVPGQTLIRFVLTEEALRELLGIDPAT